MVNYTKVMNAFMILETSIQINSTCPSIECAFEGQDNMEVTLEESYLPLEDCALQQPNLVVSMV